jgi:PAS domain S-box-containing protein
MAAEPPIRSADTPRAGATPSPLEVVSSVPPDDVEALLLMMEGTVRATGQGFFRSLVRCLAGAVGAQYAFVAEFADSPTRVRTRAFWMKDHVGENAEWDLAGTPCEDVVRGQLCHHPSGVARQFPDDKSLSDLRVESYLGVPLFAQSGAVLGHLAVFDERPMAEEPRRLSIFRIFAERAAGELERMHLERQLEEKEQRFRDLFEEAPVPYVYEDTESRFVHANRAFMKLLGLGPDDIPGMRGLSLLAPTPANQSLVHDALAAEQVGRERDFIEVELRRRDNGEPVWVQRWSRPEPDGRHTRTMLIDITARVLAERERSRLQQQNRYLKEEIRDLHPHDEIVGRSSALSSVLASIEQVAATEATVLILGESGTGKELVARAIHARSARKDQPLIKVNCSALPEGLVESELFGHERGAFTGATAKRVGRFMLADGGTIFLDEIGDMPPETQLRLLRVLQEHEFEPVGSSRTMRVDVRVIAATNRDLERAVSDGAFRLDLFYRLNVFPIHIPPLREHVEDIPLLAHYFADRYSKRHGRQVDGITSESMERLAGYSWPGNVRELQNVIERAIILSEGGRLVVRANMLGSATAPGTAGSDGTAQGPPRERAGRSERLEDVERSHLEQVLRESGWVVEGEDGAAARLGLNPSTLRSRMKRLGIARPSRGISRKP